MKKVKSKLIFKNKDWNLNIEISSNNSSRVSRWLNPKQSFSPSQWVQDLTQICLNFQNIQWNKNVKFKNVNFDFCFLTTNSVWGKITIFGFNYLLTLEVITPPQSVHDWSQSLYILFMFKIQSNIIFNFYNFYRSS